jgi:UDPglucose 6-dehydrogenase
MKEASWSLESIKNSLVFAKDEYEAMMGADALVLVTEWNQLRTLDFDRVKGLLRSPVFFDLRNVYKRANLEGMGFKYYGVGQ